MSLNDWSAEDVAQRLSGSGRSAAKRQGDGFMVCCPAHNDRTPSLSLADGSSGLLLYNCFAGCSADDVRRALEDKLGIDPNTPAGDQKDRERPPKKQIKPADEIEVIVPAPESALRGTLADFYHPKLGLPRRSGPTGWQMDRLQAGSRAMKSKTAPRKSFHGAGPATRQPAKKSFG